MQNFWTNRVAFPFRNSAQRFPKYPFKYVHKAADRSQLEYYYEFMRDDNAKCVLHPQINNKYLIWPRADKNILKSHEWIFRIFSPTCSSQICR